MKALNYSVLFNYSYIAYFFLFFAFLNAEQKKIFIISIPKAGTHLAARCVNLLTNCIPIFPAHNLGNLEEKEINCLQQNQMFVFHADPNEHNINILRKNEFKGIFITRDPRDTYISSLLDIFASQRLARVAKI